MTRKDIIRLSRAANEPRAKRISRAEQTELLAFRVPKGTRARLKKDVKRLRRFHPKLKLSSYCRMIIRRWMDEEGDDR